MSPRPFHLQWQIGSVTPHGERNIPDHGEKHCGQYQVDMKKDLVTRSCHETVSSCACGASLSCHSSWVRAFRSSQNAGLGKKQCLIHRGVKQIHMQTPFLLLSQVALLCQRWFDFICGKLGFTPLPLDYVQRFMLTFRAR